MHDAKKETSKTCSLVFASRTSIGRYHSVRVASHSQYISLIRVVITIRPVLLIACTQQKLRFHEQRLRKIYRYVSGRSRDLRPPEAFFLERTEK